MAGPHQNRFTLPRSVLVVVLLALGGLATLPYLIERRNRQVKEEAQAQARADGLRTQQLFASLQAAQVKWVEANANIDVPLDRLTLDRLDALLGDHVQGPGTARDEIDFGWGCVVWNGAHQCSIDAGFYAPKGSISKLQIPARVTIGVSGWAAPIQGSH